MRVKTALLAFGIAFFCAPLCTSAQSQAQAASDKTWVLPHGLDVKDAGPRTYKFVVDYSTANSKGEIFQRQRMTGEYTRGLPGGNLLASKLPPD